MTKPQYDKKKLTLQTELDGFLNQASKVGNKIYGLIDTFQKECKHLDKYLSWESEGIKDDYGSWNGENRWLLCSRCGAASGKYWELSHSNVPDLSDEVYKKFTRRVYKGNIR